MAELDVTEAKERWDELLARARRGEEIVLAEGGKPVAKLGPAGSNHPGIRVFGEFVGKIHPSDDFHAPLQGDDLEAWEK